MEIICDFDGTITDRDTIVFLTENYGAGPAFRDEVVEKIKSGEMLVSEAVRREMSTVKLSWSEAERILRREIAIDPTFDEFVTWCKRSKNNLSIVSAGLEPVVRLLVGHYGLPIYAHPVECHPSGWVYSRNERHNKVQILKEARARGPVVLIGDGTSDVPAATLADRLFAKSYLAEHCRREGIPHHEFENFADIRRVLATG